MTISDPRSRSAAGAGRRRCLLVVALLSALCVPAIARDKSLEAVADRAKAAFDQRAWDQAAELYGALLESSGSKAGARRRQGWATRRGKALLKARRFDVAAASLGEARQLARSTGVDQPDLDALLGFAHLQLGDLPRAIAALEAARRGWKAERDADADVLDRVTLMRQHAHVDRLLQSAHLQARNSAAAYRVAEEARAQALTAMLETRRPGLLEGGPWTFERPRPAAADPRRRPGDRRRERRRPAGFSGRRGGAGGAGRALRPPHPPHRPVPARRGRLADPAARRAAAPGALRRAARPRRRRQRGG